MVLLCIGVLCIIWVRYSLSGKVSVMLVSRINRILVMIGFG